MSVYFDSGLLLKLYAPEPDSQAVAEWIGRLPGPVWLTPFHRAEIENALHRKCARREIDAQDLAASLRLIGEELAEGLLESPPVDWDAVWASTRRLTERHVLSTQCRTFDVVHVALALHLGADEFGTTDLRQAALAQRAGLLLVAP